MQSAAIFHHHRDCSSAGAASVAATGRGATLWRDGAWRDGAGAKPRCVVETGAVLRPWEEGESSGARLEVPALAEVSFGISGAAALGAAALGATALDVGALGADGACAGVLAVGFCEGRLARREERVLTLLCHLFPFVPVCGRRQSSRRIERRQIIAFLRPDDERRDTITFEYSITSESAA